jgi:hypothetical protein
LTPTTSISALDPLARRVQRVVSATLLAVLPAGCQSYSGRTQSALSDFREGQFETAEVQFADTEFTGSDFLSGAEAGTAASAAGRWEAAIGHFDKAVAKVSEFEEEMIADPERAMEGLASWIINDNTYRYVGEGFERVYLHAFLAMAYLAQGDLDGVWVEKERANKLLEAEEGLYETEYAAGGLGHFLSAVAYELLGELDEAYIDYERMEAKGLGTALAGRSLVRIAQQLHYDDRLAQWVERYGPPVDIAPDSASIYVVGGIGLGPYKIQHSITLPTGDGLIRIVVPDYERRPQAVRGLRLSLTDTGDSLDTVQIEDVSAVAIHNLKDRLAWAAAKSAIRTFAKRELTQQLDSQYGGWGALAGNLFNLATEQADLRCWTTLPDSWHGGHFFVPPGEHALRLEALGGERVDLGRFRLDPGESMVILARTVERRLFVYPIGGVIAEPESLTLGTRPADPIQPEAVTPDPSVTPLTSP